MELNDLLMPLVNKGQSINHIFATHSDEIGLSKKTIYNYIDQSAFRVRNIDLPKKVRYKQRHSHEVLMKFDYQYRKGRTYTDFTSFMEQNPKLPIVEMDTVIGARNSGKVLLTILFRDTNFMLIFLLPDKSHQSVLHVFDKLTSLLGIELFRKLFPVILTDNGTEFKGVHNLELGKHESDDEMSIQHINLAKSLCLDILICSIMVAGIVSSFVSIPFYQTYGFLIAASLIISGLLFLKYEKEGC